MRQERKLTVMEAPISRQFSTSGPWITPADPPRGILRIDEALERFRLARFEPDPALTCWIANYWAVEWDLGDEVFQQENIPHPSINLSFEDDPANPTPGLYLTGVWPKNYQRRLSGKGQVFGVKFHPGMFRPWIDKRVSDFTGSVEALDGSRWSWEPELVNILPEVLSLPVAQRLKLVDQILLRWIPAEDPLALQLRDLILQSRTNRSIQGSADFAEFCNLQVRSLQRRFFDYVGIGPKWIIQRYRVHQALDIIHAQPPGEPCSIAYLAAELGYYDQAHFCHEFLRMTGTTPSRYMG